MKKLCIALLVLVAFFSLKAGVVPGSYYSNVAQEMATMRTRDWKEVPFFRYADKGDWDSMQRKLNTIPKSQWKIFLNTGDKNDEHALFRAMRSGHRNVITRLIKLGANPLKQNSTRVNVLEGAAATIQFLDPYLKNTRVKIEKYKRAWGH